VPDDMGPLYDVVRRDEQDRKVQDLLADEDTQIVSAVSSPLLTVDCCTLQALYGGRTGLLLSRLDPYFVLHMGNQQSRGAGRDGIFRKYYIVLYPRVVNGL
jgi:hypothetical protein